MRHSIKFLLTLLILLLSADFAHSAIKGCIDYTVPIDYSKLNQTELAAKAESYYKSAITDKELTESMTSALNLYTVLTHMDAENTTYFLRLGKLYDILGKNRYAKEQYFKAMYINKSNPEPYYYLGNYFYDRTQYKKALKYFKIAYSSGFSNNYDTLYKLGDLYQKLGDTQNALNYLDAAYSLNPNEDLSNKINTIEQADNLNKEYYRR